MKKPIKRVAVIHDLCGVGKAALTNIIPVLSIMEIETCPIPTVILSSHTGGLGKPAIIKLDNYIEEAMNHYDELGFDFEGIFIGYLGSVENINECIKYLNNKNTKKSIVVFDPIFGDNGVYYSNFDKNYSDNLREIIGFAQIITPNYTEACLLAGEEINKYVDREDVYNLCRKISRFGCGKIIITSVPLKNSHLIGTAIYDKDNDSINIIESLKQEKSYPGTGDIFTSVLLGNLMNGIELFESCQRSCMFVERCMKISSEYEYSRSEGVLLEKCLKYLIYK